MSNFSKKIKQFWMKGMQAIGKTATNIASNTKYKLDEMNLQNRRREILSDFSTKAYALWMKGEKLPNELDDMMKELKDLDERLNDLRAEHFAGQQNPSSVAGNRAGQEKAVEDADAEESDAEEAVTSEESSADLSADIEKEQSSVQAEVQVPVNADIPPVSSGDQALDKVMDNLFEETPSVHQMAGRVNEALDQMDDHFRRFDEGGKNNEDQSEATDG